jgi:hypothetical protein
MRSVRRAVRLDVPPDVAWDACMELLHTADRARGILGRRCDPDPPRVHGLLLTTVAGPGGQSRELISRFVELDPPRRVATAGEDEGPSVLTRLEVEPVGDGSQVTLTSEATTGLTGRARLLRLLDGVILGRSQRRSATATLRRVRHLCVASDKR